MSFFLTNLEGEVIVFSLAVFMRTGAFPADYRYAWTLPEYAVPDFFYTVRDPY